MHRPEPTRIKQCRDGLGIGFIGNEEAAIILTPNAAGNWAVAARLARPPPAE